jgi:aminoglycoside phosphotransferase (APT) family kinase protein
MRAEPPLHGSELTPEDQRLLRGPPPARALRWCAAAAGRGAAVTRVVALAGGTSSAVHAVDVEDARGRPRPLVLRRFVRADWLARQPDVARWEAAALALLGPTTVPAPELVACDPDGAAAGAPAVLMTRLEGEVRWRPDDLDGFLRALAGLLPAIHAVAPPAGGLLPPYAPYALGAARQPSWTRRPGVWRRAFAAFQGEPPACERRFVHRDFHPGNVLWTGDAVSGIVDWVVASIGSPGADVGHCRVNLARVLGIGAAERFRALHRDASGRDVYHPYWDIVAALGGSDAQDLERWSAREEEFLARAVGRL